MLDSIREFFQTHILSGPEPEALAPEARARRAAAALLIEMTHIDDEVSPIERATVTEVLTHSFDLSPDEAAALIDCADAERDGSTDYFQFTSLINGHFDATDKARLIEALWRVAYADDRLCKHEEFLVRKISDLIYVPHAVFIQAKHRVEAEKRVNG
jgi:uncharacterized tellurite resistance protein B-like protein